MIKDLFKIEDTGTYSILIITMRIISNPESVQVQSFSCIFLSFHGKKGRSYFEIRSAGLKEYFMFFLCSNKDNGSKRYTNKNQWQDY